MTSQILALHSELKIYQDENVKFSKENCDLQLSFHIPKNQVISLEYKINDLSQNVSKFNKGKD